HMCADMLQAVELSRAATTYALWCCDAAEPAESHRAATMAKAYAGDALAKVGASAIQVLGGIGFTWEHDLHLYLKRSQLDQVSFGDAAYHRERLACILRAKVQAGESVL
ncbi:MAG: acyl-CoA dehydrogenase family protein, partial [Mycobacterium sp.]